jgi:hypothetical protein
MKIVSRWLKNCSKKFVIVDCRGRHQKRYSVIAIPLRYFERYRITLQHWGEKLSLWALRHRYRFLKLSLCPHGNRYRFKLIKPLPYRFISIYSFCFNNYLYPLAMCGFPLCTSWRGATLHPCPRTRLPLFNILYEVPFGVFLVILVPGVNQTGHCAFCKSNNLFFNRPGVSSFFSSVECHSVNRYQPLTSPINLIMRTAAFYSLLKSSYQRMICLSLIILKPSHLCPAIR